MKCYEHNPEKDAKVFMEIKPMNIDDETLAILMTKIDRLGEELGITIGREEVVSRVTDKGTKHYTIPSGIYD